MKNVTYVKTADGLVYETEQPEYWKECSIVTPKAEGLRQYKAETRESLLRMLKPGDTVYCVIRHVSASGMQRRISLFALSDGRLCNITHSAGVIMDSRESVKGGIVVNGCGMDMCFHTVYNLGLYLWPEGSSIGRGGKPDTDGGYSLQHSTI